MADISKIQLPSGSTYNLKDRISGYITAEDVPEEIFYIDVDEYEECHTDIDALIDAITSKKAILVRVRYEEDGVGSEYIFRTYEIQFDTDMKTVDVLASYVEYDTAYLISVYSASLYFDGDTWDVTLEAELIVPSARKINNKPLISDITISASDVGAIATPSSATSNQFLMYNGTSWVASSLPIYNGAVMDDANGVSF